MSFKPFHRFSYDDVPFIKGNISKLIPSGIALTRFHEETFDELDGDIIRAGIILAEDGIPSAITDLNVELYDNAIAHLEFFLSDTVAEVLFAGMNYSSDDYAKWRVLLTVYMLSNWFTPNAPLKILLFTPRCINPIALLKIPQIAEQFKSDGVQTMINKYFVQEGLTIVPALQLVNKIKMFGYSSELLAVFNPHPFINYGPAMNVVNKLIQQNGKNDAKFAATLITLYFPVESIKAALSK